MIIGKELWLSKTPDITTFLIKCNFHLC